MFVKIVGNKLVVNLTDGVYIKDRETVYFAARMTKKLEDVLDTLSMYDAHINNISDEIKNIFKDWKKDIMGEKLSVVVINGKFNYINYFNGFCIVKADSLRDIKDNMRRIVRKYKIVYKEVGFCDYETANIIDGSYTLMHDGYGLAICRSGEVNNIQVVRYDDTYYSVNWLYQNFPLGLTIIDFDEFTFHERGYFLCNSKIPSEAEFIMMRKNLQNLIAKYNLKKYVGCPVVAKLAGILSFI